MTSADNAIGRRVSVKNARIAGVMACVPSTVVRNIKFNNSFTTSEIEDVVKIIGVQERRWVDSETSAGDLCFAAAEKLLFELDWGANSIDAIIFVSQTPDFRLPATACGLQSRLGVSSACIAFDINLGCSGYPYALWLGTTMIQSGAARRVLLAVGDTISKLVDGTDRSTALLFGDAGTVTALEYADDVNSSHFVLGTNGAGSSNLIVPHGAFKNSSLESDTRFDGKNASCLFMDGGEIFNFTLRTIPALVSSALDYSGSTVDSCDYFLFHQANLFMLKHLGKKLKLPEEKFPLNIQDYGNTSCASIPLLMATNLSHQLKNESNLMAMFGFGVGYSWASAVISVGPLRSAGVIEL